MSNGSLEGTYSKTDLGSAAESINNIMTTTDALFGTILSIPLVPLKLTMLSLAWILPVLNIINAVIEPFSQFGS